MNILEMIGMSVQPIKKTFTPFKEWQGTPIKNYQVELQVITVGDQIRIGRTLAQESMLAMQYAMKVELLSYALQTLDDKPLVTDEDFADYKEQNRVSDDFSRHDYIVMRLKQFSEQVVNALYFAYEDLQNEYVKMLKGGDLPEDLKLKNSSEASSQGSQDETAADTQGN
jgi:hypothetical protein